MKVVDGLIISVAEHISQGVEVSAAGPGSVFLTCTPHVEARGGSPK